MFPSGGCVFVDITVELAVVVGVLVLKVPADVGFVPVGADAELSVELSLLVFSAAGSSPINDGQSASSVKEQELRNNIVPVRKKHNLRYAIVSLLLL